MKGQFTMMKKVFEAIESFIKAVIYILVLTMGMTVASIATYTVLFGAIRLAQFLWLACFQDAWL